MDEYDDRFQDVSDLFQGLGQVVRYIVFGYFKMLGDLFVGKVLLPAHLKNFPTHRRTCFLQSARSAAPSLEQSGYPRPVKCIFVVGITLLLIPLKNFLTLEQINDRIAGNRVKQGFDIFSGIELGPPFPENHKNILYDLLCLFTGPQQPVQEIFDGSPVVHIDGLKSLMTSVSESFQQFGSHDLTFKRPFPAV